MKERFITIKWILSHTRSFYLPFFLIVSLGGILSVCGVGIAIASKYVIDFATAGTWNLAMAALLAFAFFITVQVSLQAVISIKIDRISEELSGSLRQQIFAHLLRSEWTDLSKYHSEDILTRLTSDVKSLSSALTDTLPGVVTLVVRFAAAFATLMYFEPMLAVLAFALGPAAVLLSRIWSRRLKYLYTRMQEAEGSYRSFLHESLLNIIIIKAFRLENQSLESLKSLHQDRLGWVLSKSRVETTAGSVLSLGYWLGYLLSFGWGAFSFAKGTATFGTFAAYLQLVEQIQNPFIELAHLIPRLTSAQASAIRLMELEKLQAEAAGAELSCHSSLGIRFDKITFSYNQSMLILKDASAEILPGETVALVGASGAGKTTLVRLLLSFIHPGSGHVYFTYNKDGLIEASAASRSFVSYVPQGNTLFSGTIAENLGLVYPSAGNDELEKACRAACAWEFIENLPHGVNTIIGEKGLGLSEGQCQRLTIARALLRQAPVLILDEATSELDGDTEISVLKAIRDLKPTPTCIIITHRPAAFEVCDRILKIEEGKLLTIVVKSS